MSPQPPPPDPRRKKRSHSVASQCSMGHNVAGSRRTSRYTLQEPPKEDEQSDLNDRQRRMVFLISMFGAGLFTAAVLLIMVTLLLTPSIDERSETQAEDGRECPPQSSREAMTLQAASTSQETCKSLGVKSFADKAVSTEDLRMASPPPQQPPLPLPPPPNVVSSVVANELMRLESAINAMMTSSDFTTTVDVPEFRPRRPRSHSHHCFFRDAAAVHPRRSRRSASAMIIFHPKYGRHVPHPGCCLGADTLSSVDVAPSEAAGAAGPSSSRGSSQHKTRKKRRKVQPVEPVIAAERVRKRTAVDPDELSKRARWTIVATACMLFFMCFLLVGITLRMTPIIDEMVRKQNEQLMNSLNRAEIASEGMPEVSSEIWNATLAGQESTPAPLDQDKKNISHSPRGD